MFNCIEYGVLSFEQKWSFKKSGLAVLFKANRILDIFIKNSEIVFAEQHSGNNLPSSRTVLDNA